MLVEDTVRTMTMPAACSGASRRSGRYQGWCFDCGERGHMARNCPRKKEKAMLTDVEEEYALL
jgi:hypothetical protein